MYRSILTAIGMVVAIGAAEAADEWGIEHEEKARVDAKVVDLLCEVTGQCTDNCGDGKRQLGLLFDDGRLVPVVKNFDTFAGAAEDLKSFCGKRITADGLMISNPKMPMFALQFKREAPDGKWSRANWFIKAWSKANPGKPGKAWYKHDPLVLELIAKDGVYGIPGLKPAE
ncbi:MAG: hypothetical protein ACR2OM_08735 [Aestuariivirgaceae bacterium]